MLSIMKYFVKTRSARTGVIVMVILRASNANFEVGTKENQFCLSLAIKGAEQICDTIQ